MTLTRTSENIEAHPYFYYFSRPTEHADKGKLNFEITDININNKFYKTIIENINKSFPKDLQEEHFQFGLGQNGTNIKSFEAYKKLKIMIENNNLKDLNNEILKYFKKFVFNFTNFLPNIIMHKGNTTSLFDDISNSRLGDDRTIPHVESLFYATSNIIINILEKMYYIGPLRENPERYYISSGNTSNYVGKTGFDYPDILYENKDHILQKTNKWLKKFTNYTVKPTNAMRKSKDKGIQNVYSLRLVDSTTNTNVNITDVGFGISQILPIIVQAFKSTDDLILIEQPEIHIHPKLQAELGSMLAEACKNNMFIIETHSENLLLRLKKLVKTKKIDKDDISIIYVDKNELGSICCPIRLDECGDFLDKWPKGFFEESFEELF